MFIYLLSGTVATILMEGNGLRNTDEAYESKVFVCVVVVDGSGGGGGVFHLWWPSAEKKNL